MHKVPYPSLSSLLGKNIKFVRGEANIMAVGKNIMWKKKGKGKQYITIFPLILRLFGRISSGEEDGSFGEDQNRYNKN